MHATATLERCGPTDGRHLTIGRGNQVRPMLVLANPSAEIQRLGIKGDIGSASFGARRRPHDDAEIVPLRQRGRMRRNQLFQCVPQLGCGRPLHEVPRRARMLQSGRNVPGRRRDDRQTSAAAQPRLPLARNQDQNTKSSRMRSVPNSHFAMLEVLLHSPFHPIVIRPDASEFACGTMSRRVRRRPRSVHGQLQGDGKRKRRQAPSLPGQSGFPQRPLEFPPACAKMG